MISPTTSVIVTMGGVFFTLSVGMAAAAGNPARGANAFRACMVCHSVKPGEHMTGPSLADVWERQAGTAEGFSRYSAALKGADLSWNERNLDKWLANPQKFIPGNSMAFQGIGNEQVRADIIVYLKAVSENKAPTAAQGGDRMGMQGARPNLKAAPPEGQVTAISYCGDAYTVRTADEKTEKVWEFNLRFKTDSSQNGPLPGKPVIIGAGMRGDRASVVFATPGEISSFIRKDCP